MIIGRIKAFGKVMAGKDIRKYFRGDLILVPYDNIDRFPADADVAIDGFGNLFSIRENIWMNGFTLRPLDFSAETIIEEF